METIAQVICPRCSGSGAYGGRMGWTCYTCQGKGFCDDADRRRNWGYNASRTLAHEGRFADEPSVQRDAPLGVTREIEVLSKLLREKRYLTVNEEEGALILQRLEDNGFVEVDANAVDTRAFAHSTQWTVTMLKQPIGFYLNLKRSLNQ